MEELEKCMPVTNKLGDEEALRICESEANKEDGHSFVLCSIQDSAAWVFVLSIKLVQFQY
eukprot:scaffold406_cov57-Cylindrotheca_fusiformis.AAC.13